MEKQTVTLRAKISFPNLTDKITFKGKPTDKYGVQLANLSAPAVEKLEALGIEVKTKPDDKYDRGQFIECRSQYPIDNSTKKHLYEADGKTPFEDAPEAIGYGTVVRATIRPYYIDGVGKPSLLRMAIEELVEPEVTASDEDDEVL